MIFVTNMLFQVMMRKEAQDLLVLLAAAVATEYRHLMHHLFYFI